MVSRRNFLRGTTAASAAVAAASVSKVALAALPEPVLQTKPDTMPPLAPSTGRPYNPVVTLNGWTLPWRMNAGVKEFHLVAEPVVREMAPGMKAHLWGYNGQSPGPTIEVVEGERVRLRVSSADGVHGLQIRRFRVNKLIPRGGQAVTIDFVAGAPGRYEILCSEECGDGHEAMAGSLIVRAKAR